MAFYDMLENFGIISQILTDASDGNKFKELTKGLLYYVFVKEIKLGNLMAKTFDFFYLKRLCWNYLVCVYFNFVTLSYIL